VRVWIWIVCAVLAGGCAIGRPDHFHALEADSLASAGANSHFVMQVNLRVSLPMSVDRDELVLSNPGTVSILEHERWASPLSEQFSRVLGQNIESRRPNVIVTSRSIADSGPTTTVAVEVVQLSLVKGVETQMEARWRIESGTHVAQGRETFVSKAPGAGFDDLVRSLDDAIGTLADRLVAGLPSGS